MKKISITIFSLIILIGCKSVSTSDEKSFTSIIVDTLLTGSFSIRAIAIDKGKVYYAANKSRVGYVTYNNVSDIKETVCTKANLDFEYRSLAITDDALFVGSIANPAVIYKISKSLEQKKLVYEENHEKVFYDSMLFWNANEGISIGDPIENCFTLLITRDGGETWKKTSCANLPELAEGEAAFAASNTNIVINGDKTWLVSGGKKARVFYSSDKGKSWKVFATPIVQGKAMTGIFTGDFYNDKIGFIAGGNYEKSKQDFQNKALTIDGGKTWKLVGENTGFGYASCIQFVPKSNGNGLVCVGTSGIYYSNDKGTSWKQMSTDANLYTLRFVDEKTAIAAGKDKIIRLSFR